MAVEPQFLVDTSICIYILDAEIPELRKRIERVPAGALVTSTIVAAELYAGIDLGNAFETARMTALLDAIPVLPFGADAALIYGRMPFKRGRFDRLIAAHALCLNLTVITANPKDFADIPGLCVEDWTVA